MFDLDGTLCWTEGEEYGTASPNPVAIRKLNELAEEGHRIVINTARGSGSGEDWHERTERQLEQWGVMYDELRVGEKPPGDIYVDDRAINSETWLEGAQPTWVDDD